MIHGKLVRLLAAVLTGEPVPVKDFDAPELSVETGVFDLVG
jgi:hypothetical protein